MDLFYETDKTFEELMKEKKNFVFIGEAGSGKSEIVLNIAHMLAGKTDRKVDLFDLDQTKPLYRSRDMKETFAKDGVEIHFQEQFQDAPTAVGGVRTSLAGAGYTLLDIGGGHQAAKFAGSYSDLLSKRIRFGLYCKPYRPWTGNLERCGGPCLISAFYPAGSYLSFRKSNLGYTTTEDEFISGWKNR